MTTQEKSCEEIAREICESGVLNKAATSKMIAEALLSKQKTIEELMAEVDRLKLDNAIIRGGNECKRKELSHLKSVIEKKDRVLKDSKDAILTLIKSKKKLNEDNGMFWIKDIDEALSPLSGEDDKEGGKA